LAAEFRRAEAHNFDVRSLLARCIAIRGFDDADDIAAVLHSRIASAIARDPSVRRSLKGARLVVGLIPSAAGPMDSDMRRAFDERTGLMEARVSAVLDTALLAGAPWTRALGAKPREGAAAWRRCAYTVAAYRDRYGIVSSRTLGQAPQSTAQEIDAARARAALRDAQRLAEDSRLYLEPNPLVTAGLPPVGIRF
jgi:hypothetical protein